MIDVKKIVPWWSKILVKLIISRLPIKYNFWKRIGLIEHGAMEEPSYAYGVFHQHFARFQRHCEQNNLPNKRFVSLELGPGDSLFSAMINKALGGSVSYLIDVGYFAVQDIQKYQAMANFLAQEGLHTLDIHHLQHIDEILDYCCANYLTSGLESLKKIPDKSVNFIWSHGVLELVRRTEFFDTLRELRRIIRDDGVCSHLIPLVNSLGELNSLRFPEFIWESDFMAQSGFYANRIQYSQMLELFRKAGFDVEVVEVNHWKELPTPKSKLSKEFRDIPNNELRISSFSVILKPI